MSIEEKLRALRQIIRRYGPMAVAFSGGVDSVFLLKIAAGELGPEGVIAVTVEAPNFCATESGEAEAFAASLGVRQIIVQWDALSLPEFVENSPQRCYFCKKELLGRIAEAARANGMVVLADGGNVDDMDDYRPGLRAVKEMGVVSPLALAGFGKADIRACLRDMGIAMWNKPAAACLASRVPYGMEITGEILERVEKGEDFLRGLGLNQIRLRHHGDLARIEAGPAERERFRDSEFCVRVAEELTRLGYLYVTLDLQGYRMGSLNAAVARDQ